MSQVTDFLKNLVGASTGGGSGTTVTASANNQVTVNPEITAINVIDTGPLKDLLGEVVQVSQDQADQAELAQAARESFFTDLRLWLAVGAFGLAVMRTRKIL